MKSIFCIALAIGSTVAAGEHLDGGHVDGNGTGGIRFWNDKIQIYDLWEGENQEYLLGAQENLSYDLPSNVDSLEWALTRLANAAPKFASVLRSCIPFLKARSEYLPEGMEFTPPQDIDASVLPHGAKLVRIAAMDDRATVKIDGRIFKVADRLTQAALFFHEAAYWEQRKRLNIRDSSAWARLVTACAFADNCSINELSKRASDIEAKYPAYNICTH